MRLFAGAARVLIEAHGPIRHHLGLGIGVQLRQRLELVLGHAGKLRDMIRGVFRDEPLVLLEAHRLGVVGLGGVFRVLLARMRRAQSVADVGRAAAEIHVPGDEILIDLAVLDDVVGDVIENREIGLRLEHDRDIGQARQNQ
jgi:hypothetical protein